MSHAAPLNIANVRRATRRKPRRKIVAETNTIAIQVFNSSPYFVRGLFKAALMGSGSPRFVVSMARHLRKRLTRQGANPARAPAQHGSTEQSAEELGYGVLKATAHHFETSPDETPERNNGASENGKSFERGHQSCCPRKIYGALSVCGNCAHQHQKHRGGMPGASNNTAAPRF